MHLPRPSIKVDGSDIMKFSENEMSEFHRKKIGFVFQKFNLLPMLNVRENIVLPLTLGGDPVDNEYIDELIFRRETKNLVTVLVRSNAPDAIIPYRMEQKQAGCQ